MNADKACIKFGIKKPLEAFRKKASKPDGYDNVCKMCVKRYYEKSKHAKKPVVDHHPVKYGPQPISSISDEPHRFSDMNPESLAKAMKASGVHIEKHIDDHPTDLDHDGTLRAMKEAASILVSLSDKRVLVLDFTDFPWMFEAVSKISTHEFRTPEMQILYMLQHSIKNSLNIIDTIGD